MWILGLRRLINIIVNHKREILDPNNFSMIKWFWYTFVFSIQFQSFSTFLFLCFYFSNSGLYVYTTIWHFDVCNELYLLKVMNCVFHTRLFLSTLKANVSKTPGLLWLIFAVRIFIFPSRKQVHCIECNSQDIKSP